MAITLFLLAIEVLVGLRYQVHDFANEILLAHGWYQQRLFPQQVIVAALSTTFFTGVLLTLICITFATWATRIASSITTALVGLFVIEGVSLHTIDLVLWAPYYHVVLVGWLWVACTSAIALAAIWRSTHSVRRGRQ